MQRDRLSLRAQAVTWLAQREHSELELRRKLLRHLQAAAQLVEASSAHTVADVLDPLEPNDSGDVPSSPSGQVDALIAWLRERGYLDEARFVASRIHVRSNRFGLARIQHELAQHGLALPAESAQVLRASELERATALWKRKFGRAPNDAPEAARQARFLVGRGFSGDVVRQVLRASSRLRDEEREGF